MARFEFGWLPSRVGFRTPDVEVRELPDWAERAQRVQDGANADGFRYPPIIDRRVGDVVVKRSGRPAHLFRLPGSHWIEVNAASAEPIARETAGFAMHLLGFLQGVWLQFADWWFDRRVPVKPRCRFRLTDEQRSSVVGIALGRWKSWPRDIQSHMTNVLYIHCRSPSYEWEWERFMMDYAALDACWRVGSQTQVFQASGVTHAKRIEHMCGAMSLRFDQKRVRSIVRLRNGLLHEALWDGLQPGTAKSAATLEAPANLRRLNTRLILAMLGVRVTFVSTPWWHLGTWAFDTT